MPPLRGARHCYAHDPERESDRRTSRRRGGLHRRRAAPQALGIPVRLDTVAAIQAYLELTAVDLGRSEAGVARARAQIALAATAIRVVELLELEQRLTALEARLLDSPS